MSKILIIDDDPAHLATASGILEAEGHEVFLQQQAFGSTNAVIRVEPDLVLLDVNMPGLSGDRLAQVLRSNANTRDVLIMLHSSNDEDHLRTTTRRLGLDGYICKGSPSMLRTKVAALLSRTDGGEQAAPRY